jgi:cholesterol transport system auxiliary component
MTRRPFSFASLMLLMMLVASMCGCAQRTGEKNYYVLGTARVDRAVRTGSDAILEVRRFSIDPSFADPSLVYRLDEFRYEFDYYNEYLVPPALMLTQQARTWLARSGVAAHLLMAGSRIQPTHTLETNVTAMYGDFRDPSAPRAVLEVRCFLLDDREPTETIAMARVYGASHPIEEKTADAVVAALDAALERILTQLEEDLAAALADAAS